MNPTGRRLGGYALLAYSLSWACWLPLALTHRVVHVGGWPTHLPGLLGPAAAAFAVTAVATGRDGVRDLARRVGRWRIGWWWLIAVSPLGLLGVGYLVQRPAAPDLWNINGFPLWDRTAVITGAMLLVVADIRTGGRTLAPADISRRTTWTPGRASRIPGPSRPTAPLAPR